MIEVEVKLPVAELAKIKAKLLKTGFKETGFIEEHDTYFDNKQVIVVKADSGIDSLSDLAGKNVETQKDSSALAALQGDQKSLADTFAALVEVADYNTAFMDLESGACDAIAVDIGVAHYQINSRDASDQFIILPENISSEQYGIGFKEGNTQFYNYRLDRIKNIEILDKEISIKKKKSEIKEFAESSVEMFGGKKEEIEAICHIWLLDTVFDVFGRNVTIEKIQNDDTYFKLIVDTNPMGFRMWAMRNIDLIEVKRPLSLREEMKKIIKNAGKRYGI